MPLEASPVKGTVVLPPVGFPVLEGAGAEAPVGPAVDGGPVLVG